LRKEYSDLTELEREKEKENLDLKDALYNLNMKITQDDYEIKGLKGSLDEFKNYLDQMTLQLQETEKQLRETIYDHNMINEKLKERENDLTVLSENFNQLQEDKNETDSNLRKANKA